MKRFLLAGLFLVLLFGAFRGGTWYSQRWAGENNNPGGDRPILHYVDPMNPANVSDKPGIAPCGMPMEPVYGDREKGDMDAQIPGRTLPPGTVQITPKKQQIIGVRIGTAEMVSETHGIRTLGRIAADENRVYPLVSAADGWMSYILGNTTGSVVQKNQLMALVRIYSYDFFSWQQRYLADLANLGRRRLPMTNYTGANNPSLTDAGRAPHASTMPPVSLPAAGMFPLDMQTEEETSVVPEPEAVSPAPQNVPPPPAVKAPLEMPFSAMQARVSPPPDASPGEMPRSETSLPQKSAHKEKPPAPKQSMSGHSMHDGNNRSDSIDPAFMGEDDILYASKARLELLNYGVGESQLDELSRTGKYVTTIELRSPVTGLLIDRRVSPLQKVERGTECFRVADLSRVWILADVFNAEAAYIQPGMSARISLPRQNKQFEARVSDILPVFDGATRTLKVRLEMNNPNNEFRPEMFVDVEVLVPLPAAITVPADAVLDSGQKKIVFVALGNGYFEPREVVTGWRFDDRVEIVKGLSPGEQIVISGNFLIDSESRMKQAIAGLMAKPTTKNGSSGKEKQGVPDQKKSSHD